MSADSHDFVATEGKREKPRVMPPPAPGSLGGGEGAVAIWYFSAAVGTLLFEQRLVSRAELLPRHRSIWGESADQISLKLADLCSNKAMPTAAAKCQVVIIAVCIFQTGVRFRPGRRGEPVILGGRPLIRREISDGTKIIEGAKLEAFSSSVRPNWASRGGAVSRYRAQSGEQQCPSL